MGRDPAVACAHASQRKFYIGRRTFITKRFGAERWDAFAAALAAREPAFAKPILVTSLVPMEAYVVFQEACLKAFFAGDENAYWEMGEEAAVWALTDGPYAALATGKSYELLMSKLPLVWTMYFTTGTLETAALPGVASFKIVGNELPHICIEYVVMGFARRAIEMVGKVTKETRRLRGIKDGDGSVVHYEFVI